jgi:hypothetical protein
MSAINLTNIPAATTSATSVTPLQAYFKARRPEVQELKDALQSGDLAGAQQAYNNLVSLGKTMLDRNNPFLRTDRAADFSAIGNALASGNLAAAQQAFAVLHGTFGNEPPVANPEGTPVGQPAAGANLSNTGNTAADVGLSSSNTKGASSGVNVVA